MLQIPCRFAVMVLIVALAACGGSGSGGGEPEPDAAVPDFWQEGLSPGVNPGLSADYPDDVGIADDPYVIAAEDFEAGEVLIYTEEDRYKNNVTVVDTISYTGTYSAEHAWPEGLNGPTCRFPLPPEAHADERPAYFVRMCFNYDSSFHPGDPSIPVGVKGFGIYNEEGPSGANTPCDGTNWYDVAMQFVGWGPSQKEEANDQFIWEGHMYSYNPAPEDAVPMLNGDLRVTDPPVGDEPYRFSVYPDPHHYIRFGDWHCYELGLYLNTPGRPDGEARFWVDGVLRNRTVHMTFRTVEGLYPTSIHLNLHRTTEDFPQTMLRYADNIVIARRYIGPVSTQ